MQARRPAPVPVAVLLCHCLLFVNKDGYPITEYLPEGHEALESYGVIEDPEPEKGRPLRDKAAEREQERINRPS